MITSFSSGLRVAFSSTSGSSSSSSSSSFSTLQKASAVSKKYTAKDLLQIFPEVQLTDKKIIGLITEYLFTDFQLFLQDPSHLFINLTDITILKKYLRRDIQKQDIHDLKNDINAAKTTVSYIYETPAFSLSSKKYGWIFPTEPEALSHAMQFVKGKTVLEIASGNGLHGIMLAYAGAKKVHINEVLTPEMNKLRLAIPLAYDVLENNLKIIECNFFSILNSHPELANVHDFILCRNFLHFCATADQERFFSLLKKLSKPGAKIMLTVNCAYAHIKTSYKIFKENLDKSLFKMVQCYTSNKNGRPDIFFQEFSPIAQEPPHLSIIEDKIDLPLHLNKKGEITPKNNNQFTMLFDVNLQSRIRESVKSFFKEILPILTDGGELRVNSCFIQIFNKGNLSSLVRKHGFIVEDVYFISPNGHYIPEEEVMKKQVQQMGIIFRNPS